MSARYRSQKRPHQSPGWMLLEKKLTFPPAIELDRDALVHVLFQVQDVLLLGPLLVLPVCLGAACPRCCCCCCSAPASSSSTSRTASPAAVGSVCHAGFFEKGVLVVWGKLPVRDRVRRGR
jgi:hypothetical protein